MADIQNIVQQVLGQIQSDPQILQNLMEHPYSTIGNITNNDNVTKDEASEVVVAASALAAGQSVDFSNLASMAQQLMGNNGNSTHALANQLLGGLLGSGTTGTSGISADVISNLAGVAFGNGSANNANAVNLADGIDLGDIIGIASSLFGNK